MMIATVDLPKPLLAPLGAVARRHDHREHSEEALEQPHDHVVLCFGNSRCTARKRASASARTP
jgi:hypothetical protein